MTSESTIILEADLDIPSTELTLIEPPPNRDIVLHYTEAGLSADVAARLEVRAERIRSVQQHAIMDIGKQLLAARQEATHGTWGLFLDRVGLAEATARNYMNVAERFGDAPPAISATVADLPPKLQYTLAAPKADPAAVDQVITEVAAGASVPSVAEARERVTPKPTPALAPTPVRPSPAPTPPAPVALTPLTIPAAAPASTSNDLSARTLLAAKLEIARALVDLLEDDLQRLTTSTAPTIVIRGDLALSSAQGLINSPALGSAAGLLVLSARVEG